MNKARFSLVVTAFLFLGLSSPVLAAKAYFAGGCFWCMESDFEKLEGVSEVISGFTGGTVDMPTYSGNHAGHYEAVEIEYDPAVVSYQQLLSYYWHHIDPFDDSGQFCDKGPSYRPAIFTVTKEEKELADASRQKVVEQFPDLEVVTPVLPFDKFYPITGNESYHQDYYKNYPNKYRFYRWRCGRDARIEEIWGAK